MDADVAVHPYVSAYGLMVTLHEQVHYLFVRPEVAGVGDGDPGVFGGELLAPMSDAFFEDAGEEEVGEDGDPPDAQLLEAFQPLGDVRRGHANVRGLHHRVRAPLVEEARDLGEVGVGVGVRGAATDDEDGSLVFLLLGDGGGDPLVHKGEELGPDAESPAVLEANVRTAHLLAHKGGGDVVLGVAGGEEHEGDGGYLSRPASGQTLHALGDRGPRELYKTALNRECRIALPDQRDELVELAGSPRMPAAVPDDE